MVPHGKHHPTSSLRLDHSSGAIIEDLGVGSQLLDFLGMDQIRRQTSQGKESSIKNIPLRRF